MSEQEYIAGVGIIVRDEHLRTNTLIEECLEDSNIPPQYWGMIKVICRTMMAEAIYSKEIKDFKIKQLLKKYSPDEK